MLRVRALASSFVLRTGEYKPVSTSISVIPELALFDGNGHTWRWNAGTTHFINSFSKKSIVTKLMTEKLDPLMKKRTHKKPSSGSHCLAEIMTSLESNPLTQETTSASRKISNASVRNVPNQLEFSGEELEKITESSRRTTSVSGTTATGICLPICPTQASETVTIRISNISTKTAVSTIHSICKSVGPLEGLTRKNANEVEALFTATNNLDSQSILEQLDCKIVNKCKWSAWISTEDPSPAPVIIKDDDELTLEDHISSGIANLKRQIVGEFLTKRSLLEDLENLHASLVHLENHPNKLDNSSEN